MFIIPVDRLVIPVDRLVIPVDRLVIPVDRLVIPVDRLVIPACLRPVSRSACHTGVLFRQRTDQPLAEGRYPEILKKDWIPDYSTPE